LPILARQPDLPSGFAILPAVEMPTERADARRNRLRVLEAAQELLAADPRGTTMEDIARAAGVGKGTLYRRFKDRSAVAAALLDEHERRLQERLLRDPPPLGPGAPPAERLVAFYAAYADLLERAGHLSLAIETTEQRLRTGAHRAWLLHVAGLLGPGHDVLAEQLLAPLAPDLYAFQREELRHTREQIAAALGDLAHRVLGERR
jgi:AcrR family transcriptional regulator